MKLEPEPKPEPEPVTADRPLTLIRALAWRTRAEGVLYLFIPVALFTGVITLAIVTSLTGTGHINGAKALAAFAERYGAHADAVTVGIGLLLGPGLVALFSCLSVAQLVRNLIGTEASRGGIEALLAAPYRPGTIMTALLGYVGAVATLYWACMSAIATIALAAVTWSTGARVSLTASYLLAALIVPLLAAWAATGLALLVNLLYPQLAQAGSYGINTGGAGMAGMPAMLPGLGVLFVFLFWASSVSAGELLGVAGGTVAAVAVTGVATIARRFRPDAVLES
jgi:hypothetical protein